MLSSFVGFGLTSEAKPESKPAKEEQTLGEETQVSSVEIESNTAIIKRVIDGDTIETESGLKIRYIGIDTPEMGQGSKATECYAEEAKKKNRELVEGKEVRLERDVSETDKYGRLLRYIWINDVMINELLAREGYAQSSSYPPDIKYQERFREAEKLAREEERGLWGGICISPIPTATTYQKQYIQPTPTGYIAPTPTPYVPPTYVPTPTSSGSGGGPWTCDCSRTCSRDITSCEEAYFQLDTCGCSRRDGDNDGVPCENLCPGG